VPETPFRRQIATLSPSGNPILSVLPDVYSILRDFLLKLAWFFRPFQDLHEAETWFPASGTCFQRPEPVYTRDPRANPPSGRWKPWFPASGTMVSSVACWVCARTCLKTVSGTPETGFWGPKTRFFHVFALFSLFSRFFRPHFSWKIAIIWYPVFDPNLTPNFDQILTFFSLFFTFFHFFSLFFTFFTPQNRGVKLSQFSSWNWPRNHEKSGKKVKKSEKKWKKVKICNFFTFFTFLTPFQLENCDNSGNTKIVKKTRFFALFFTFFHFFHVFSCFGVLTFSYVLRRFRCIFFSNFHFFSLFLRFRKKTRFFAISDPISAGKLR